MRREQTRDNWVPGWEFTVPYVTLALHLWGWLSHCSAEETVPKGLRFLFFHFVYRTLKVTHLKRGQFL